MLINSPDNVSINLATAHSFHHSQVLEVVVRLEQGVAGEELDENASYAPDVAGEAPSQVQDNLWRAIVSCRDHRRVVLIVKCGRPKVDEPYLGVKKHLAVSCCAIDRRRRRRYCAVVCEGLVRILDQQDVLGLEIGVDEIQVVQEGDTGEELLCKLLDMRAWEGDEAVALEEVEHALAVEVGDDADVVAEVEAVSKVDAPVDVVLVIRGQGRQHPQFDAAGIAIFWYRADDLDGALCAFPLVVGLDHLAKGALAE